MEIYIFRNGVQEGPFQIESITTLNLEPADLVWCRGMEDWQPANQARATAHLFAAPEAPVAPQAPAAPAMPTPPPFHQQAQPQPQPQPQPAYQYNQQPQADEQKPARPNNNLVLSIITLACCCLPLGIVSLIYAVKVNDKYNAGDYDGAVDAANKARNWAIGGIIGGFLVQVVYIVLMAATGFLENI